MATIVYFDGFNLYYGALKGTAYKWLDLAALWRRLLPNDEVVAIRYFTALVAARPDDPQQPQRQQAYLRRCGRSPASRSISVTTSPTPCACRSPLRSPAVRGRWRSS